jgi:hypothetical protein
MAAGLGMSVVDVLDIENDVAMDAELRTTPRGPPGWKPGPPGSENARCEPPTEKPVVLTRDYYLPHLLLLTIGCSPSGFAANWPSMSWAHG